jgi:hypothetical protein
VRINTATTATLALARPRNITAAAGVRGISVSVAPAFMTAAAAANRKNDATGGMAWNPPV